MKNFTIIAVLLVLATCAVFMSVYNGIVSKNEVIAAKWSQVENQLQRRNDLIPNLVNSVKGYAVHEKTIFEDVAKARSQWSQSASIDDKVKAASGMDSAVSRLLAVAENYPQLKADGTFLRLMDELSGTENRISVERMRYNDAVMDFNVTVRRFPGNLVAGMYGLKPVSGYFKADEKSKTTVPVVKFE